MHPSGWPVSRFHPVAIKFFKRGMIQDDFMTCLLINTPESHRTVDEIALKLLSVNFAAVHTSSLNMGHALYWLLARYVVR
jgi:cytochrome P450